MQVEYREWSEVVRKGKKASKGKTKTPVPVKAPSTRPTKLTRRLHTPAIIVDVSKEEFPSKKLRGAAYGEIIGDHTVGMCQTKTGSLLIRVHGDQAQVESVRAEISRLACSDVAVRHLKQKYLIEVRDLDKWPTAEEIMVAISRCVGDHSDTKVVNVRRLYDGVQSALVSAPTVTANKLVDLGRLHVCMGS